jgi:hypothetical protein
MFDDMDLCELIQLAIYLEGKAERGLFPKAKFKRYSDNLDRLIDLLARAGDYLDDPNGSELPAFAADIAQRRSGLPSSRKPATILTHPRFRGRRRREP